LFNALGEAYLKAGSKDLAIAAFEKALKLTRNDHFALIGLERAGKPTQIQTPEPERAYNTDSLEKYGPKQWSPIAAPALEASDVDGNTVKLTELAGKNVILVFYLGKECPHCLKQLKDLKAKSSEWKQLNTVVLAVSGNSAEQNRSLLGDEAYQGIRFLSDKDHANAKRFLSYDDFEGMELHATIVIDKEGKLRWSRVGGEPFEDMGFLAKTLEAVR
jgi:peroxiredoxin